MRVITKAGSLGALMLLAASVASAEMHGQMDRGKGGMGQMMGQMHGNMQMPMMDPLLAPVMMSACPMMGAGNDREDRIEDRLKKTKDLLKITDEQDDLWSEYEKAIERNVEKSEDARKSMQTMKSATSPERLSAHIQMMESRIAMLKDVQPALNALYNGLSDDQKKKVSTSDGGGMGCPMMRDS